MAASPVDLLHGLLLQVAQTALEILHLGNGHDRGSATGLV
jgi:hypothetical protein